MSDASISDFVEAAEPGNVAGTIADLNICSARKKKGKNEGAKKQDGKM